MKKCDKCGREMVDEACFCPRCGSPQRKEIPLKNEFEANSTLLSTITKKIPLSESKINLLKNTFLNLFRKTESDTPVASKIWQALAVIGALITAFSVFSPVIVISGYRYIVLSFMGFSTGMAMIILAGCCSIVYALVKRQYAIITIVSNGLLLFFYVVVGIYLKKVSESYMVFLDIVIGGLIFYIGISILSLSGILCGISANSRGIFSIFKQWFEYSIEDVTIANKKIPGLLMTSVISGLLIVLTFIAVKALES